MLARNATTAAAIFRGALIVLNSEVNPVFQWASFKQGEFRVGHDSVGRSDSTSPRRSARVAAQPRLGILPERGPGPDRGHPGHLAVAGSHLRVVRRAWQTTKEISHPMVAGGCLNFNGRFKPRQLGCKGTGWTSRSGAETGPIGAGRTNRDAACEDCAGVFAFRLAWLVSSLKRHWLSPLLLGVKPDGLLQRGPEADGFGLKTRRFRRVSARQGSRYTK